MAERFVVRPEEFGARAGQDCTAAFRAMMDAVEDRLARDAGGGVPVAQVEIRLGAGPYLVSGLVMQPRAGRAQALTITGLGKRTSEVVMTGAGPLFHNADRWMGVRIRDCSFRSTSPGAVFLLSESTGAAQDWVFSNVEWRGTWDYAIGLDGPAKSNTNSEFGFDHCHVNGSYRRAFLWSGMSPEHEQQDQFLNYWFRDCKVEYDWGTFLRFDKGGFVSVSGGSYIIKGQPPAATQAAGASRFYRPALPPVSRRFRIIASSLMPGARRTAPSTTAGRPSGQSSASTRWCSPAHHTDISTAAAIRWCRCSRIPPTRPLTPAASPTRFAASCASSGRRAPRPACTIFKPCRAQWSSIRSKVSQSRPPAATYRESIWAISPASVIVSVKDWRRRAACLSVRSPLRLGLP